MHSCPHRVPLEWKILRQAWVATKQACSIQQAGIKDIEQAIVGSRREEEEEKGKGIGMWLAPLTTAPGLPSNPWAPCIVLYTVREQRWWGDEVVGRWGGKSELDGEMGEGGVSEAATQVTSKTYSDDHNRWAMKVMKRKREWFGHSGWWHHVFPRSDGCSKFHCDYIKDIFYRFKNTIYFYTDMSTGYKCNLMSVT